MRMFRRYGDYIVFRVSQNEGGFRGAPYNKGFDILGFIGESPIVGKLPQ